jgi:hypothetical protein
MIDCRKIIFKFLKRKASVLMIAFMLGMSNVILEETRMVNDTRIKTEQQEVLPDEDPIDILDLFDA